MATPEEEQLLQGYREQLASNGVPPDQIEAKAQEALNWYKSQVQNPLGQNAPAAQAKAAGARNDADAANYYADQTRKVGLAGGAGLLDPNAFNYGGWAGGAHQASAEAWDNANLYKGNSQKTFRYGNEGMVAGYGSLGDARKVRNQQMTAADLMMARAQGKVPSIAEQVAQRQTQQAMAQQASLAASARGPAAMALAQQNAAGNMANAQSQISANASVAAAQERLAAEQAAFGAYGGVRGQDIGAAQTGFQGAGVAYGASAQQGTLGLGYNQLQNQIESEQLNAKMREQGLKADMYNAAMGSAERASTNAQAREDRKNEAYLNAGTTLVDEGMKLSDARAKVPVTWATPDGYAQPYDPWLSTNPQAPTASMLDARQAQTADDAGKPVMGPSASVPSWLEQDMAKRETGNPYDRTAGLKIPGKSEKKDEGVSAKDAIGVGATVGGLALAAKGLFGLSDMRSKDPSPFLPPVQNQASPFMTSDDRTKLAAAWDEGHQAAVKDAQKLAAMDPQKLKELSTRSPVAATVRTIKADTYDEARGKPAASQHIVQPTYRAAGEMDPEARALYAQQFGHAPGEPESDNAKALRHMKPMAQAPNIIPGEWANANRAQASQPYAYKPGFSPDQAPGEVNVGPMAQTMAQDPAAATAVKKDPKTGLLLIDKDKLLKLHSAGLSSLQGEVDQLRAMVGRGKR